MSKGDLGHIGLQGPYQKLKGFRTAPHAKACHFGMWVILS